MNPFKAVKDFHIKYNQSTDTDIDTDVDLLNLRGNLIAEEMTELSEELFKFPANKAAITKEIADNIYVMIGLAVSFGLPLEEVFKRVHESNMTKDGDKRGDGKVTKGPSYVPPQLDDLFDE